MPGFGEIPNLERLNLEECVKLEQIDPSIGVLRKLVFLNLKGCKNLIGIPNNIFGLSSLEDVNLSKRHLNKLDTSESASSHSQSTSSNKWITRPFHSLYPRAHTGLLPSLPSLSCLRELDISFCGLSQISDAIGCLDWLERLNLGGNNFVALPSLKKLSKLVYLNLQHCKQLKSLPELPSSPAALEGVDHMLLYTEKGRAGLYIFNCPELGESSSMTFSWMLQFIQANQESAASLHWIDIVIPGIEIPGWFKNQRMGDMISIDTSRLMCDIDNKIIGITCCAVFSVEPDHPATTTNEHNPNLVLGFQGPRDAFTEIPVILGGDLITVKSNHMWLIYFTREAFVDLLRYLNKTANDLVVIKMRVFIGSNRCVFKEDLQVFHFANMHHEGSQVEVKSCGYRWVFKQDLQQFNLTMMH